MSFRLGSAVPRTPMEVAGAKEGAKVLRSERYYGKVSRTFTLGSDVDDSQSQAKYSDGVLMLTLPKKAANAAKKLTIQ